MKLILAVPTYGPIDPHAARALRGAIMHASQHGGVEWVGDLSPDRMKFDVSRNFVVKGALETDADGVFWVDSDVILPVDGISRLVATGQDFITGIYFQRMKPFWPLIAHFSPTHGPDQTGAFNWFTHWPENVVAPIDGCGFGCVLTSTLMLRKMTPPWFTFEKFSEDFDFCLRAAKTGTQLYVHTGVLCGHLADPVPVTVMDFTRGQQKEQDDGTVRSGAA